VDNVSGNLAVDDRTEDAVTHCIVLVLLYAAYGDSVYCKHSLERE
jgi:hypothetical protein